MGEGMPGFYREIGVLQLMNPFVFYKRSTPPLEALGIYS
jgi:hypothetical protein